MTMHGDDADVDEERRSRRRKVLALIASGAVLGIGAIVTLAVWNDAEFATGNFSSGSFDLLGDADGSGFTSSPDGPGKTLTFAVIPDDLLSPGDVVYAPFAVELSSASSYAASVTLQNAAADIDGLTYSLYAIGEPASWGDGCSAGDPPSTSALVTDQAAGTTLDAHVFDLTAAATPTYLCFVVTAGDDLTQGATGTVTWEFQGTAGALL